MIWNFIFLVVAAGIVWFILRYLRPKLRRSRYERWEREGLLPHQTDPYAPRAEDTTDSGDPGSGAGSR